MRNTSRPGSGGMEGDGAYNRHAKFQADGSTIALLLLQEAAEKIEIACGNEPVVVADYGSSQGKNSLKPMRATIETLRGRIGSNRAIMVCHIDLPVNDFNSLFKTLDTDANSYSRSAANVYSCAVGRSFYENVLPAECVHIGWSAYAVQWLSRIPAVPVDHFWFTRLNAAARAIYERQAAEDWENFLALRANELRPGGRLVVVCPGVGDCQTIADHVDPVIADMVNEGAISADERARMVIAGWQRSEREYLAPFHHDGRFRNLTVEHCESVPRADPMWEQYQRDGDTETFAAKQAAHFRATFVPSLAAVLTRADEAETRRTFADRIERGLKQRLLREPTPYSARVDAIVFAKLATPTA
jgi:SAM dependent carboxyl methyltransferase